ncbi:hypothetical protein BaRGS_00009811 [Batillaria attramentaria]|uniref:Uncharacterized protein n=1 Tax=Batillaria attramentaria TaxID=370345 RepID=A0ABD0LJ40_9CAEN
MLTVKAVLSGTSERNRKLKISRHYTYQRHFRQQTYKTAKVLLRVKRLPFDNVQRKVPDQWYIGHSDRQQSMSVVATDAEAMEPKGYVT